MPPTEGTSFFSQESKRQIKMVAGFLDQAKQMFGASHECLPLCNLQCSFQHISALRNPPAKIEYRERTLRKRTRVKVVFF